MQSYGHDIFFHIMLDKPIILYIIEYIQYKQSKIKI